MQGIYIHIPFCKQACNYCNFHFSTSLLRKDELVQALIKEINIVAASLPGPVETIYFGGGTPSLLTVEEIDAILKQVHQFYHVDSRAEITLEANPDDISNEKLEGWKQAGINRLSIGVQSFFDEDLQWMNRAHNAVASRHALTLALQYFNNITIDLIYGVPGLSDLRWKQNVQTAIDFGIPHLSCYALTVEPKTALDKMVRNHKRADVDPEQQSRQFLLLMDWLAEAGYEHYEISNFAKPGHRSRHNSSYWQGKPYVGIGPAAHSYDGKNRRWNVANNQKYIQSIEQGILPFEEEQLTPVQRLNEYIMISLRTMEGLDLGKLTDDEKNAVLKAAKKHIDQKLIQQRNSTLLLTKEGKLFADGIASDLFF